MYKFVSVSECAEKKKIARFNGKLRNVSDMPTITKKDHVLTVLYYSYKCINKRYGSYTDTHISYSNRLQLNF